MVKESWVVTDNSACTLDEVEKKKISFHSGGNYTIMESTCFDSNDPSLMGETTNSLSRHFGLFCPPLTSLYTFNIQSTGPSRLYLSPNASSQYKQVIASTASAESGWDLYPEEMSQPILLEAGKQYYMEVVSVQCSDSWNLCFGAKMHNLNWTNKQAMADHEVQLINISSAVANETQVI